MRRLEEHTCVHTSWASPGDSLCSSWPSQHSPASCSAAEGLVVAVEGFSPALHAQHKHNPHKDSARNPGDLVLRLLPHPGLHPPFQAGWTSCAEPAPSCRISGNVLSWVGHVSRAPVNSSIRSASHAS
ncbi:hypothetical protein KIL84_010102 [Mauremys mutica]|uniref:Uncharacterized protein n=1 Tax=Mauremys mutica TaxID=74926 RepID=A0A9D3XN76_9SAUR|nr:hypothetical protein KIL84_010102 [Mauremys mutica]